MGIEIALQRYTIRARALLRCISHRAPKGVRRLNGRRQYIVQFGFHGAPNDEHKTRRVSARRREYIEVYLHNEAIQMHRIYAFTACRVDIYGLSAQLYKLVEILPHLVFGRNLYIWYKSFVQRLPRNGAIKSYLMWFVFTAGSHLCSGY